MTNHVFDAIWLRIEMHVGEVFRTKTDLEFTYDVDQTAFFPSRTKYRISKSDFETAYNLVPYDGPGLLSRRIRGPSYVWAVLHDSRIRRSDW